MGCVANSCKAAANLSAFMPYMGGELRSLSCAIGGYRSDVCLGLAFLEGGEFGGVTIWFCDGSGPGEQYGICLFGTGAGDDCVLSLRDGVKGGVVLVAWFRAGCCCTTIVAMLYGLRMGIQPLLSCSRMYTTESGRAGKG